MKKKNKSPMELGRRERQIMTFIYQQGEATAAEVMEGISNPPSYSGVRAMLRILEEKGHLTHRREGARYIYEPVLSSEEAGRSAMNYMVQAFFNGSAERAVAALLDLKSKELSDNDLDRLSGLIEQAKQEEE
jgi:predicted transcriptional regulator